MTMSNYSNAVVDVMLGWLKGFANWVLRLFNLAGSVSGSPLLWLSRNWLKLLVFFLVLGVVVDRLIWLIRWRPYWVWFRKERIIVNDDKFFTSAELDPDAEWNEDLEERDYVVASTVVKRRDGEKPSGAVVRDGRRPGQKQAVRSGRTAQTARRGTAGGKTAPNRGENGRRASQSPNGGAKRQNEVKASAPGDIFDRKLKRAEVTDSYEDEVFNVSNLPVSDEFLSNEKQK